MIAFFARLRPYRWLLLTIIGLIALRALVLPVSPPGFYVDEAASGAHVVAMLRHGTDAHGHTWPLFAASLGGGYTTAVYLYPIVGWAALFGTSELALRSFSMIATMFACIILGLALRQWMHSTRFGLIGTAVSFALPWGWLQGSLAWDPALVPICVALSFYGLSLLYTNTSRPWHVTGHVLLPISIVLLAYVYPPCRITAPLLFLGYYGLLLWHRKISLRSALIAVPLTLLAVIPLAIFMVQPDALGRSQTLSVFHGGIIAGLGQFVLNLLALFSPVFLFVTGDPNLRHSSGIEGMLGLAAIIPLIAIVWQVIIYRNQWRAAFTKQSPIAWLAMLALFGIISSYIGSALTSEGQPHSLRACAAWPFYVILITLGWQAILRSSGYKRWIPLAIAGIATALYAFDLGVTYPVRAADAFDTSIHRAIISHHEVAYPSLALDYYRWR